LLALRGKNSPKRAHLFKRLRTDQVRKARQAGAFSEEKPGRMERIPEVEGTWS